VFRVGKICWTAADSMRLQMSELQFTWLFWQIG